MRIKIYAVDQETNAETFEAECDLRDAVDQDDPEFIEALDELTRVGRYWIGGGAAALSLLVRC